MVFLEAAQRVPRASTTTGPRPSKRRKGRGRICDAERSRPIHYGRASEVDTLTDSDDGISDIEAWGIETDHVRHGTIKPKGKAKRKKGKK